MKRIMIRVTNLQKKVGVDTGFVRDVARKVLALCEERKKSLREYSIVLDIILVDNKFIKGLNRKFRNVNKVTDVIAFSGGKDEQFASPARFGYLFLGDVFISVEKARSQARELQHSIKKEIAILTVHGILHLLGYKDQGKNEALTMKRREQEILCRLE